MANDPKHRADLAFVEGRIEAGYTLIAAQQIRLEWARERGLDTTICLHLLKQLQFSQRLLIATRDMLFRELEGIEASGARVAC